MRYLIATAALAIAAIGIAPATAAAEDDRAAQLEERLAETKARLDLTDEQIEQITPILEAGFDAQMAVLDKHGIDLQDRTDGEHERIGFRAMRALRGDLQEVRADTLEQLGDVLTDEQMAEYKKIQEERRAELRERIRERR